MSKTPEATAIAEAIAKALLTAKPSKVKAKGKGRVKSTPEQSAARSAANDAEALRVFSAAGYKDVQPRVNVKTYGKEATADRPATGWLAEGRRVKKGEKGLQVGPFNLFHFEQTEAIAIAAPATETVH